MFDYLAQRELFAKSKVDQLSEADVLDGDESDLVAGVFEQASIHPIEFQWDEKYQDPPREAAITVRDQFANEVYRTRGTTIVIHVPFTGDAKLLGVEPTAGNMRVAHATVSGSEIRLTWEGPPQDASQIKASLEEEITQVKRQAGWSKADCEGFNTQLDAKVRRWLAERRRHLETNRKIAEVLDIPIGRRPSPSQDLVPVPRRRPIAIQRLTHATAQVDRELRISESDYEAVVEQLSSARSMFERLPETFSPMGEESLRDVLLAILNNQFGPAVGELFSRKGKTDIAIVSGRGPVFIAECKNWEGAAAFLKAIDQLLGYLAWRDTKAALVVFVRVKDVTAVTERALKELSGHPQFVAAGVSINEVPTVVLHHEGDRQRHIRVALIIVPIPPVT